MAEAAETRSTAARGAKQQDTAGGRSFTGQCTVARQLTIIG